MRKRISMFLFGATLSACASQEDGPTQDTEQAVRDFIEVRQLAEADKIRTASKDHWNEIDQNFIIYKKRNDAYLIEFVRRCVELDQYPIVPDERRGNEIRARFETIRGCRIAKRFPLSEGELTELEAIGESTGSRN